MAHPTEDELYNYVFDQQSPTDLTHVTTCPSCRQTIGELSQLAKLLSDARLSQPSPAQYERCVQIFTQHSGAGRG